VTSILTLGRLGVALGATLALLLTTAAAALAGASSYGPAPASFFYDDGQYAIFAGPGFDADEGCPPGDDPDAHYVTTGAGTVHTQGSHDVGKVTVYDMDDYGVSTPLGVLFAICFDGEADEPVMVGDGTVRLNNTNCDPGPNGCYAPGSSWTAKNWLRATVYDGAGVARDIKTFVRAEVELPLDGPPVETLLHQQVRIR
jgi:hypothetical protein